MPVKVKAVSDKDKIDNDLYVYWTSWIKRSKKLQPVESWTKAENMLVIGDSKEKSPYLSGFRLLYEALKSYLDQQDPTFDVVPTSAYFGDQFTLKAAECDKKYLDYVWGEQDMQKVQSQKLDSALIRNHGCSLLGFDTKKWMPKLSFLKSVKVYVDPDCDGIRENAKAIAYEEDISAEEFVSKYKLKDIKGVLKKAGNILTSEEQENLPDDIDKKMFRTVKIYHIFAKGDAALRKNDSEKEIPEEKDVMTLVDTEPKRYLQFAEGYHKPLFDGEWPYDIDNNEFPTTELMFNTIAGNYYSYTDNDHMERMDEFCDGIMSDIDKNAELTGRKKFGGSDLANDLDRTAIDNFLNDPTVHYLPKFLDAQGNPKIKQMDVGQFEFQLMNVYKLASDVRKESSALGELLSNTAESYKDVTAIAVRVQEANSHQRVNRRLSGIFGYEESIKEDAIKVLEIAHQYVPTLSVVEIPDELGESQMVKLEWRKDIQDEQGNVKSTYPVFEAIAQGGKLIQLGVDAIVGSELAQYWREGQPQMVFKLSTNVRVKKGSTRDTTQENKAAMMKQFYVEVLAPFYQATNRMDLAAEYIKTMGQMASIDHIDELVPTQEDAQRAMQKNEEAEQIAKQTAMGEANAASAPQGGSSAPV